MKKLLAKIIDVDNLLVPRPGEGFDGDTPEIDVEGTKFENDINFEELRIVGDLPEVTIESTITTIIKTILELSMLIALVTLVFMGIYYLQSLGNEEDLTKSKNMMIYLLLGAAIIAIAYGVIVGIAEFDFFS